MLAVAVALVALTLFPASHLQNDKVVGERLATFVSYEVSVATRGKSTRLYKATLEDGTGIKFTMLRQLPYIKPGTVVVLREYRNQKTERSSYAFVRFRDDDLNENPRRAQIQKDP